MCDEENLLQSEIELNFSLKREPKHEAEAKHRNVTEPSY